VSEPFWTISVLLTRGTERCEFTWARGRLFSRIAAAALHSLCLAAPTATVLSVDGRQRSRRAPPPLNTLEMQKRGSSYLRMGGDRIMRLAEELYQGGFVSYPRTETDSFASGTNLLELVGPQAAGDAPWAPFARRILDGEQWKFPHGGGHDDKAHPPIHPVRAYPCDGANVEKERLYEFIVRHFLA
jgi:DNA topoisomerase III